VLEPERFVLDGRVAVVTGAAAGIGAAVALAFARFGADVALCDRDEAGLAATAAAVGELGHSATTAVLDVRDDDAVQAFIGGLERVDVLVNNAGGGFFAAFADVSGKGQDALIRENFTSVTSCIRAAVAKVPETGGSIVNVTSIEAHRAAPGYAVYSAMKAAVENITRTLALELGARRIRVNCVAPDVIPTPGIGDLGPPRTPLPYSGHVDDVAAAVLFLASDASRFVTGTTIHVDGGNLAAGGWHRTDDGGFVP
jgi:NAD(P)-dependent dehydrogenase (short-subunit alcohol dehydrogenase family)